MKVCLLMALILIFCSPSFASLESLFRSLGAGVNISSSGSYKDQSAGYYTAGGFSMRTKNNTVNPINVSLPKIHAGCGGIDAYMGSLSFISAEKMVDLLKGLGQKAATYAFQLGLKTMAPQIEGLLSQLQKIAMETNNFLVEDCRMVESSFAAVLPKDSAMGQHACADVMQYGGERDWFEAKERCKSFKIQKETHATLKQNNPDQLIGAYNLLWQASKKARIEAGEAERIMTLVGSIISREETPGEGEPMYRTHFLEAQADRTEQLEGYLKGGRVEKFVCNDADTCLFPQIEIHTISDEDALVGRTRVLVASMRLKYKEKQPFNEGEKKFLDVVGEKIPLYKYIQLSTAAGAHFLDEIIEYIALYILLVNVEQISNSVMGWVGALESVQMADLDLQKFKENLAQLKTHLLMRLGGLEHKLWAYMKKAQTLEATILAREYV
tara:strand:+ start:1156 stop:2475 length:1320 start_codon:yes stop_codon:yes gene_type:complete